MGGQMRPLPTPLHPCEAYAGKVFARVVLGCIQAFVLLAPGAIVFKLPMGAYSGPFRTGIPE